MPKNINIKEAILCSALVLATGCYPAKNPTPTYDPADRWTIGGYVEDSVNTTDLSGTWIMVSTTVDIDLTYTGGALIGTNIHQTGSLRSTCMIDDSVPNSPAISCFILEGGYWNGKVFTSSGSTAGSAISSDDGTVSMTVNSTTSISGSYYQLFEDTLVPDADYVGAMNFDMIKVGDAAYDLGSFTANVDGNSYAIQPEKAYEIQTSSVTTPAGGSPGPVEVAPPGYGLQFLSSGGSAYFATDAAAIETMNVTTASGTVTSSGTSLYTADVSSKGLLTIDYAGIDDNAANSPTLGAYDGTASINF